MNNQANSTKISCIATVAALSLSVLLGGCASIPDVTVTYRPVKWALSVTVVHTITCNRETSPGEKNQVVVDRNAVFLPLYSAASSDTRFQIRLKDLDRYTADAEFSIFFTDDGRLKSINQSTTGQGEAAVKGLVGFAAAFSARSPEPTPSAASHARNTTPQAQGVRLFSDKTTNELAKNADASKVCELVKKYSIPAPKEELAQISLIQTAMIRSDTVNPIFAKPSSESQDELLKALKSVNLDLKAKINTRLLDDELQPIFQPQLTVVSSEVPVTLQRMRSFVVEVKDEEGPISSKSVPVPTKDVFVVPIPKAALFGKQAFMLSLADSGKITNIGYARTTGASGALGAATALAGADVTEDNAEGAALKVASDLIAQQQRYNKCRINPSDCK